MRIVKNEEGRVSKYKKHTYTAETNSILCFGTYIFFYEKTTTTTTVNKPVHYAQVRWSPKELPHAWTC